VFEQVKVQTCNDRRYADSHVQHAIRDMGCEAHIDGTKFTRCKTSEYIHSFRVFAHCDLHTHSGGARAGSQEEGILRRKVS
jgi:hypothetical protein